MANVAPLNVEVRLGMEPAGEVVRTAQVLEGHLAHAGHDPHIERDIDAVGHLDADLAEARARGSHEKGDDVHRPPLHGAGVNFGESIVRFRRSHPVIVRPGSVFFLGANEGEVLCARDVIVVAAMEIATGQLFLIQRDELPGENRCFHEPLTLLIGSVAPDDIVGPA